MLEADGAHQQEQCHDWEIHPPWQTAWLMWQGILIPKGKMKHLLRLETMIYYAQRLAPHPESSYGLFDLGSDGCVDQISLVHIRLKNTQKSALEHLELLVQETSH